MTLITPQQLIDYTIFDDVKERDPRLLQMDIVEAQNDIFELTSVDFEDKEKYPSIPGVVEIACLKLSQYYALVNQDEASVEQMQSEKLGNYSYQRQSEKTASGSYQSTGFIKPNVRSLLSKWIKDKHKNGTAQFRLRSI